MKRITQVDLGNWFKLPNPGLRAYIQHVIAGNQEDYRPPFWKGKSRKEVIAAWTEKFERLDVDSKMPGLKAFEFEMREKIGPLSIQAPLDQRIESVEQYYTSVEKAGIPIDPMAIRSYQETLRGVRGITLRTQCNVVSKMRLSTNSGNPYFGRRRKEIEETLPAAVYTHGNQTIQEIGPNVSQWPITAVLGWRGQEGGPKPQDVKQRVVWMFPFAINIMELQFYQPAIEAWQRLHINSAYESMRAVEVKITRLFDTKGDEYVVVTDFSKFDQHFNSNLQDAARSCEEFILDMNDDRSHVWLEEVFPVKFNIPLLCSDRLLYQGHHGMGSGSGGTNFDECCGHGCLQHEVAILHGQALNPFSNAYGDDGYLSYKGIDVDDVISAYTSHGLEMNPDKQSVDKHSAVYLRRYFHDSYRDKDGIMLGVYSTFRALGRLLGQERYYDPDIWNAKMVELRALSILENCANSPIFKEFVDFVLSGDKYRLGLGIPGFLDSLKQEAKQAIELQDDLLGYTKSLQKDDFRGIDQWKVVQYLRSLR